MIVKPTVLLGRSLSWSQQRHLQDRKGVPGHNPPLCGDRGQGHECWHYLLHVSLLESQKTMARQPKTTDSPVAKICLVLEASCGPDKSQDARGHTGNNMPETRKLQETGLCTTVLPVTRTSSKGCRDTTLRGDTGQGSRVLALFTTRLTVMLI